MAEAPQNPEMQAIGAPQNPDRTITGERVHLNAEDGGRTLVVQVRELDGTITEVRAQSPDSWQYVLASD